MNKELVSVICPTHNSERYIDETIFCVLSQSYENLELIIVDDCSTDRTVERVKKINDSRIKLIVNEKNSGAAFSRNVALRNANGEYVAFLDGDDLWLPGKLEKQIQFMKEHKYMFTYTDYELVDENGKRLKILYTGPKRVTYRKFLRIDYIGTSTVIYKKEICPLLQIPNDIYKRNDDALWLTLSKFADCYRFPMVFSQYRRSGNSISSGSKAKLYKHHVILYKKLYGFSSFRANLYAIRNVFYYILKQIKYRKKLKN